jgi:predicted permease
MRAEGFVAGPQGPPQARFDAVGPDYLRTMGITLLKGRDIDQRDTASADRVVVISEAMADRYFANTNPIGRRMLWGPPNALQNLEIVGVARNVKHHDPRDDMRLRFYVPYFQQSRVDLDSVRFIVRTAAEPRAMLSALRQAVHSEDSRLPIVGVDTAATLADRTLAQERMVATLSAAFAALALTLTCIGLYGLLAYRVARRTNEIGIRMALGASRPGVLWTVVRLDLVLIVTGVMLGVPLALGVSQLGKSLLFGVDPTDGVVLGTATLVMVLVGVLAGAIPGYRASQVEPIAALRHE